MKIHYIHITTIYQSSTSMLRDEVVRILWFNVLDILSELFFILAELKNLTASVELFYRFFSQFLLSCT